MILKELELQDREKYFSDGKLLPETLAQDIATDVLLGPDGDYWVYSQGVFKRDPMIIQRRCNHLLKNALSVQNTNKVRHAVDPELEFISSDAPADKLINLANCMIDYTTQERFEHAIEYRSFIQIPVEYEPEATCPIFDDFLSKIIDPENLTLIWEVIGYLLIPGNPLQKAILAYGPGSNGKSTFFNVIEKMVGKQNTSNITLNQLTRTFEPAELFGKQLNSVGDLDMQYLENTENFKKITGGDPITAQRKNKDPFTFVNWATPIFATNTLWKSSDLSHGYFRRWEVIPFTNKISSADFTHSFEQMTSNHELSGIFNKALPYIKPLLERKAFTSSPSIKELMSQFQKESDNVAIWLEDDDDLTLNPDLYDRRSYIYDHYRKWCYATGHRALSNQGFYKRLEQLNYNVRTHKDNQRVILGISIKKIGTN